VKAAVGAVGARGIAQRDQRALDVGRVAAAAVVRFRSTDAGVAW
jgi:hypothetical protein